MKQTTNVLLLATILVLLTPTTEAFDFSNAIFYYNYDTPAGWNGTHAIDQNGKFNATAHNDVTSGDGFNDEGLYFDGGDDYINHSLNTLLNVTGFTYCSWYNGTDASGVVIHKEGISGSCDGCRGYYLGVGNGGNVRMGTGSGYRYAAGLNLDEGKFHHVCATYNATLNTFDDIKLFVNGTEVGAYATTGTFYTPKLTEKFYIGVTSNIDNDLLGTLDETVVFNYTLTENEIEQLYNDSVFPPAPPVATGGYDSHYNNTVLYLKMESNDTVINEVGQNGTNYGAYTTTSGLFYNAYDFDGTNDYINMTNDVQNEMNSSSRFTINLWFKQNKTQTTDFFFAGINDVNYLHNHIFIAYDEGTDVLTARAKADAGQLTLSTTRNAFGSYYFDGNWHMLSFVHNYTGTTKNVTLWIDGSLIDSDQETNTNGLSYGDGTWVIGHDDGNPGFNYYNGSLDEFAIFNQSFGDEGIAYLYANGNGRQYPFRSLLNITGRGLISNQIIPNVSFTSTYAVQGNYTQNLTVDIGEQTFSYNKTGWTNASFTYNITTYPFMDLNITMHDTVVVFNDSDTGTELYPTCLYNGSTFNSDTVEKLRLEAHNIEDRTLICNHTTYQLLTVIVPNTSLPQTLEYHFKNATIDNCTNNTVAILNFTIYNENTPANKLISDFEIDIDYWYTSGNATTYKNYSVRMEGDNSYLICINSNNETINLDAYIKYAVDGGFTHRYYLINDSFTNETVYHSMYNFNDTTGVSDLRGLVRYAENYNYYPGILAKLERYYPAEDGGLWRVVQMDKSGDFGLVFFNIIEETTDYRMKFLDEQEHLLRTTDTLKFSCTAGVCEITVLLDPYEEGAVSRGLIVSYEYVPSANVINVTWDDPLELTTSVRVKATKEVYGGIATICNHTTYSYNGHYECNVAGYEGEIFLAIYSSASPEEPFESYWVRINETNLAGIIQAEGWGNEEGALWTFGIVLTTAMSGLLGPIPPLITVVIGLIIAGPLLGLLNAISVAVIIVVAAITIGLSYALKK